MTRIGILGAGMIANVHAEAIAATGSDIISVFDPREEQLEAFTAKWKCDSCTDADALLSRSDVEAVVIATPNDQHASLAIASLRSGKDVLLEKPMAMSLDECDKILATQQETAQLLQLGFVCRFAPAALKVKQMIDDGMLGTIRHARASLLRQRGIPGLGGWFTTKARSGGGCLIDIGVHLIDLLAHLTSAGDPERVLGQCSQTFNLDNYSYDEMWSTPKLGGTFDVEDGVQATIGFQSGCTAQIDITWATHVPESAIRDGLTIVGDKGAVSFDIWGDHIAFGTSVDGKPSESRVEVQVVDGWAEAFQGEHKAFATGIETREVSFPASSGNDGRKVQTIVEAIYESSDAKKEVHISTQA